jgi:tRNA-uridine 2-sulfurtransferase
MTKTRVVVAMSGGVDSSVAAALLVEQGYDVVGIMLRLWAEEGKDAYGQPNSNRCCAPEAVADARAIAKMLGIPFYDVHAEQVFKQRVVDPWIGAYADATTPNPCFSCNRSIRFGFLMQRALALGAAYLATGHYARVARGAGQDVPSPESGVSSGLSGNRGAALGTRDFRLLKGRDEKKDQSYVLHVLGQKDLARAMFPCGGFVKAEVRELARKFNLPTAERPESQDLCFLTQGDYRGFLVRQMPEVAVPGPIVTPAGVEIGRHDGLPFYTVGQRKGLNITVKTSDSQPLFVLKLDAGRNALVVGTADQLGARQAFVGAMHYCADAPPQQPLRCTAKVRYKATEAAGVLRPLPNGSAEFVFDEPHRDVTPGQGLVCYLGDEVVGGGVVSRARS